VRHPGQGNYFQEDKHITMTVKLDTDVAIIDGGPAGMATARQAIA
jgi:NADPH-dependent glutamate synthase beta subunit-like oxidoreductase